MRVRATGSLNSEDTPNIIGKAPAAVVADVIIKALILPDTAFTTLFFLIYSDRSIIELFTVIPVSMTIQMNLGN